MEHSPLLLLPSEIRNIIYDLVLNSSDVMDIHIDNHGVPNPGPEHKLAITMTCEQMREEAIDFGATTTTTFLLKPVYTKTLLKNMTITNLFDMDAWLNVIREYPYIDPRRMTLCVGLFEVSHISDMLGSQLEFENIVNRIPLEGITRSDIDFAIQIGIVASPALRYDLVIPLDDDMAIEALGILPKAIGEGVKTLKRRVGGLVAEDWKTMSLSQGEVVKRKAELWSSVHLAQKALSRFLCKVYFSRDRVSEGKTRHPVEGDAEYSKWVLHE